LPDYIETMAHFGEAGLCAPLSETTPVVVEGSDGAEILLVNHARRLSFFGSLRYSLAKIMSMARKSACRRREGCGRLKFINVRSRRPASLCSVLDVLVSLSSFRSYKGGS